MEGGGVRGGGLAGEACIKCGAPLISSTLRANAEVDGAGGRSYNHRDSSSSERVGSTGIFKRLLHLQAQRSVRFFASLGKRFVFKLVAGEAQRFSRLVEMIVAALMRDGASSRAAQAARPDRGRRVRGHLRLTHCCNRCDGRMRGERGRRAWA